MKRRSVIIFIMLLLLSAIVPMYGAVSAAPDKAPLSIVFTHDMHSYLEATEKAVDGKVIHTGGFAKLSTAIKEIKAEYPQTLLVDGGDFSMGTLYQTIYSDCAPELVLMGALGYDATTLGNHEFDYRTEGLTKMLQAAVSSKSPLPQLLCANIDWDNTLKDPALAPQAQALQAAMATYGVKPYTIIEKDGCRIALFGILGNEAISFAPMSGLKFKDPIEASKSVVSEILSSEKPDIILCLSHSGTVSDLNKSEDVLLARAVPQIDVILSAHSHTVLKSPIIEGNTIIVSCGSYLDYVGHLVVTKNDDGRFSVQSYSLLPLDDNLQEDGGMASKVSAFRQLVNEHYLKRYGYEMGEVVAKSPYSFTPIDKFSKVQREDSLGNLIADSYVYAASKTYDKKVDVAVVPAGVVRGSFDIGDIRAENVFNVSSLGIGPDKVPGYPLVSIYLTGRELWDLCEVDASVSDIMQDARLYMAGLSYTQNPHRLFLNRVTEVYLVSANGSKEVPQDDKLYRVVGGLYSTQMLGTVKDKSFGLLSLVPKDKDGNAITDFESHILYKGQEEYKEWVALADYLQSFEKQDGVPVIPKKYAVLEGRKVIEDSRSPIAILKHPNKVFFLLLGVVLFVILLLSLIVFWIYYMFRKRRQKRLLQAR